MAMLGTQADGKVSRVENHKREVKVYIAPCVP